MFCVHLLKRSSCFWKFSLTFIEDFEAKIKTELVGTIAAPDPVTTPDPIIASGPNPLTTPGPRPHCHPDPGLHHSPGPLSPLPLWTPSLK